MRGIISHVMDEERVKKIFELKGQGLSNRQIAKRLGAHQLSVAKYLDMDLEEAIRYVREIKVKRIEPGKLRKEAILEDIMAREWLDSLSEGSIKGYITGLGYYCEIADKKPTELLEEARSEIKAGLLLNERGYFRYLNQFEKMLKGQGFAPNTVQYYLTAARSFYGFYQFFDLPKKRGRNKDRKVRPLKENIQSQITKNDVEDMLSVAKYLRDKAMILTIASSGLGRAEIVLLRIKDFFEGYDDETGLCLLRVRRQKTGTDFMAFVSPEATTMIWDYLKKEREIGKENIKDHINEALFAVTKNTFKGGEALKAPLVPAAVDRIFRDIGKRLGVTSSINGNGNIIFTRYHPHNIRKFFNTEMKNAGMPEYMVEYLMGHEISSTKVAYYQRKVDELKENYLRFMPAVIIQPTETQILASGEYKELSDKITLYEAALKERNGEIAKLREEMETMKRDGHYHQLAYDFVKLLSRDPTAATRFSEFIDREKLREKD
jgi:integrase